MFKFFHLIGGTTFFGIMIASFFYITHSIKKNDLSLIHYALKASYVGDAIIFFIIIIQIITANRLVSDGYFTLSVPWISMAYYAFGVIILLWLSILWVKLNYLVKKDISTIAIKIFYLLNVMTILIFMIIIHDAVTHNTWFNFLFRKS